MMFAEAGEKCENTSQDQGLARKVENRYSFNCVFFAFTLRSAIDSFMVRVLSIDFIKISNRPRAELVLSDTNISFWFICPKHVPHVKPSTLPFAYRHISERNGVRNASRGWPQISLPRCPR